MATMPEEMAAIFDYIKEKLASNEKEWRITREAHLTVQPDGKVGGWTLHSYNGHPQAWDLRITIYNSARIHTEFWYFRANTRSNDKWEKFESTDLLDDIDFKLVDQALNMLDTIKGGMRNFGNFDEFGNFLGKSWV